MGEPIKRATLSAVAKEYEARGNVGKPQVDQPQEFNPGAVFFGVYTDALLSPIQPGDSLYINGFYPSTLSYSNAVKRVLRNKIKLDVRKTSSQTPRAVALTGAKYGHICKFKAVDGNLYFAHINVADDQTSYAYVDEDGNATNTEADAFADLLFRTSASNGRAVAMCQRTGGGGGVSIQDVDDEIDATLTAAKKTKTVITSVSASIDAQGYLSIATGGASITYYGES